MARITVSHPVFLRSAARRPATSQTLGIVRLPSSRSHIIASMAKTTPDHHDAELLIQVYDLRREA